jgi:hypothetical protein
MLEKLSDEALAEFGGVLAALSSRSGEAEAYSATLHRWLFDAAAREQAIRRGEAQDALLMPRIPPAEMARARVFACALATCFENLSEFCTPKTRTAYVALAQEIAPALLSLGEALAFTTEPAGVQH